MKLCIRFLFTASLLAGAVLHGQEPEERKTGKVLLLRSGHVMEGNIEKVGSQMRIKSGASEIWISEEKTRRLCADWDDAYVFLQTLVKLDDADGRVKLARWCHMNQQNAKALEQAKYALELQPGHVEAKQIVTTLERLLNEPAKKPAPQPLETTGPIRPKEKPFSVDVTTETLISFGSKVQPILMNTCANCHSTGRGGRFELERVSSSTQKAATQRNLAMVLTYLDLKRPAISPLLTRSIQNHGNGMQAPIQNRDAKAFQTMHQWIEFAIARNPQLHDYADAGRSLVSAKPASFASLEPGVRSQESGVRSQESGVRSQESGVRSQESGFASHDLKPTAKDRTAVAPTKMPAVTVDEHDPAVFNDAYHPKR